MSILNLAKRTVSKGAGVAWKHSGASNIPALEGSRKALASRFSRNKNKNNQAPEAPKLQGTAPEPRVSSQPSAAPASNVIPLFGAAQPSGDPEKGAIEANRTAHAAAMAAQNNSQPSDNSQSASPQMEKDIHEMRKMMEEGAGMGGAGGALTGMLGSLMGMIKKIPGMGKIAGWGAGALAAGKGMLGRAGGFAKGAMSAIREGRIGSTIAGSLGKASTFAKGIGTTVAEKASGLVPAATSFVPAIKAGIGNVVEKGGKLVSGLTTKGAGLAASVGSTVMGAAKGAMSYGGEALSAVKNKAGSVIEAGKGLAGKAIGAAKSLLPSAAGAGAAKLGGAAVAKTAVKKVPILGLLAGVGFGIKRAVDGDWAGAGMEVASGLASTIPGAGTAASVGIDAALIARDISKNGEEPKPEDIAEAAKAAPAGTAAALAAQGVSEAKPMTVSAATPAGTSAVLAAQKVSSDGAVPQGLANLQAFVAAALDEKQGVFVRLARNELQDNVDRGGYQQASYSPQATQSGGGSAPVASRPSMAGDMASIPQQAGGRQAAQSGMQTTPDGVTRRAATNPGGGTLQPGVQPGTSKFAKVEPTTGLASSALGNLISRGEGDYNSYNSGTKGVAGGKVGHSGKKDLSTMTLNEILESSEKRNGNDKDRVFAAGRYQIITPTLKGAMKKMGLKGDEKFTPELQDRIFQEALLPKTARDYITGKSDNMEGAQLDLAKEWRSFADPRTGKTYADAGASANKASITAAESAKALQATREQYAKGQGTGGSDFALQSPQNKTAEILAGEAKKDSESKSAPIIVQAPAVQAPAPSSAPSSGGAAGIGGHMGTRNDDSSIRRITDAKMGYGMV